MSPLESFSCGQREPYAHGRSDSVWWLVVSAAAAICVLFYFFSKKSAEQTQGRVLPWILDSGGPTTTNPLEIVPREQLKAMESADTVMFEPIVLDSWVEDIANLDGKTYLVCRGCVLRYDGTEKMTLAVLLPEGLRIRGKRHIDCYWEVCSSDFQSEFVGLLQCHDGKWTFSCYPGEAVGAVGSSFEKEGTLVLLMEGNDRSIVFNPETGKFLDM